MFTNAFINAFVEDVSSGSFTGSIGAAQLLQFAHDKSYLPSFCIPIFLSCLGSCRTLSSLNVGDYYVPVSGY